MTPSFTDIGFWLSRQPSLNNGSGWRAVLLINGKQKGKHQSWSPDMGVD